MRARLPNVKEPPSFSFFASAEVLFPVTGDPMKKSIDLSIGNARFLRLCRRARGKAQIVWRNQKNTTYLILDLPTAPLPARR